MTLQSYSLGSTAFSGPIADSSLAQPAFLMQWNGAAFPPQLGSTGADIAANFIGNKYQAAGASQSTFTAWLTALGGTFSRATPATFIDGGVLKTAAVNVPRIGANGLRLTGGITNLALQSNNFNVTWGLNGWAAVPGGIGPDGVSSAWINVPNTTIDHYTTQPFTFVSGSVCCSCFFKPNGYKYGYVTITDGTGNNRYAANVDLTTGVVTSTFSVGSPTSPQSGSILLANGWTLVWVSIGTAAGPGNIIVGACNVASPTWQVSYAYPQFAGDGVSGIYMFGAQVTQTAFPCDYIPTTTAAASQNADNLYFPYAHTTFSVLVGTNNQSPSSGSGLVIVGEQTQGVTPIYLGIGAFSTWNGSNGISAAPFAGTSYSPHKIMAAGSNAGRSITSDGAAPASDANAFVVFNQMALGSYSSGSQPSFGNLSQLAVWTNIVATPTQMQQLTL